MNHPFNCIAQDISGAEGPCVDLENRIFMVEPNRERILEIQPDGVKREHANTGGIPAGLQCDQENNLWCADMKLGIFRIASDGKFFHEVASYDGKPIRGCNDCYFDSQGNLYFTAPAGSNKDTPVGQLFCRLQDGKVVELDRGFYFCNGLAVNADDSRLAVAETFTKLVWLYDIVEPGKIINRRKLCELTGENCLGPDGMDFDIEGNLLVTNCYGGSIDVFTLDGKLVEKVKTPFAKVTNVHFLGPNSRMLLVTECSAHGLWKTTWHTTGQLQYCNLPAQAGRKK